MGIYKKIACYYPQNMIFLGIGSNFLSIYPNTSIFPKNSRQNGYSESKILYIPTRHPFAESLMSCTFPHLYQRMLFPSVHPSQKSFYIRQPFQNAAYASNTLSKTDSRPCRQTLPLNQCSAPGQSAAEAGQYDFIAAL